MNGVAEIFCHFLSFYHGLRSAMNFASFMVRVEPLTAEFVSDMGYFQVSYCIIFICYCQCFLIS